MPFELSASLSADITNFRSNFNQAGEVATTLDNRISTISKNISRNVAAFNSASVSRFVASLNNGSAAINNVSVATSALSSNVSRNISAINNTGLTAFISSLSAAQSAETQTASASSVLSANISRNISAVNNTGLTTFISSLSQAESAQNRVGVASSVLSTTISRNIAAVNRVNLSQFNAALQAGTLSLTRLNNVPPLNPRPVVVGANQAAFALTNLGRVAQDAPFGFIGIQNNLNPLLESFQRLRAETGSNQAAFKALTSSLMGPAGIGIALSVVGAAILFYQQYQQKAARETANSEAAMKKAKKTAEEYALSLDDVTRARLVGSQNAQKEITELRTLYSVTQDTSISSKQRKEAVDELQKTYPEYFKNIKDEIILSGGASDAYDRLTTSIIATARARAAEDIITKNSSRQLENLQKITDARIAYTKANEKLIALDKKRAMLGAAGGTSELSGVTAPIAKARSKAADELNDAAKILREAKVDNNLLDERNLKLTTEITNQVKIGADLSGKVGDLNSDREKKVKTLSDVIKDLNVDLEQAELAFGSTFGERATKKIDVYQKAIEELVKLGYKPASEEVNNLIEAQRRLFQLPGFAPLKGSVNQSLPEQRNGLGQTGLNGISNVKDESLNAYKTILKNARKAKDALVKINSEISDVLKNGLSDSLYGVGNAIGSALATGASVVEAVGASLLGSLGSVLTELGKMAISVGVGLFGIKAALKSLNPAIAIAAGVALVALGSFVSTKASSIGDKVSGGGSGGSNVTAFANGGIISGPTLGLMGEYAGAKADPEVVAPLSKLKGMLGDDDIRATGSGDQQVFIAESKVTGEDIVTVYRRAERRLGRIG